jgi:hypothetical protein
MNSSANNGKSTNILRTEAVGFSFLILLSWLAEILHIPHLIFGEDFTPNWKRAILRTIMVLLIWTWVHLVTRRLLKRLHYLEEFLRVCSWCRKVSHDNEWLEMEKYFNSRFATKTSHGMCPDCLRKKKVEIAEQEKSPLAR